MSPEDEKVCQKLLTNSRKFFTCPVLRVRIRKTECLTRHLRLPTLSKGGRIRVLLYNKPEDHFCRSTECETGKRIWKQVRNRT